MAANNLLVAGGAVVNALGQAAPQQQGRLGDVDLFFYGCDEDRATALLRRVVDHLMAQDGAPMLVRGAHHVSVVFGGGEIYQFILRLFRDPLQVLASFDLPVCRCGFAPALGVVATEGAAFALATSLLLVDVCSLNRAASEARIAKYTTRDFVAVFPCAVKPPVTGPHPSMVLGRFHLYPPHYAGNSSTHTALSYAGMGNSRRGCPKDEEVGVGEYGESPLSLDQLRLFNLRRARDGDAPETFACTAASFDALLQAPQVLANEGDVAARFAQGNFNRSDFAEWNYLECYTIWDIEERFDEEHAARLMSARDQAHQAFLLVGRPIDLAPIREVIASMAELSRSRIAAAARVRHSKLWDDVSSCASRVAPWSGYLVAREEEFYGSSYAQLPAVRVPHDYAVTFKLLRTRHVLWMALPRDVWVILRRLLLPCLQVKAAAEQMLNYFHS
jgi:hypothetical protein